MSINRNKPVTFSPEALQAVIAEATAIALAKQREEFLAAMTEMQQQARQAQPKSAAKSNVSTMNDAKVIKVFAKAGFKDIKPRINVLTFNKWVELGRRPMEGSRSLKVSNLRLFHISQTREVTKADLAKMAEQKAEAAKRKGKVIPIKEGASV